MDAADAHALMAVMQGEWRKGEWIVEEGPGFGDLTTRGTMFALVLADYAAEVGAEAINRLRARIPYRDGPQTADLKAALREVSGEAVLETPALPAHLDIPPCCIGASFGHWYRDHADEDMRTRTVALLEMPKRPRHDETVIQETFARVVGGKS